MIWNVIVLRIKSMYSDWAVRLLAILLLSVISWLIYSLYSNSEDTTKLKIGINFEKPSEATERILKGVEDGNILKPILMSKKEGLLAVEEGRIECFFIFKYNMGMDLAEDGYKEMVDMYLVRGNHIPYIISDVLAGAFIGEMTVTQALLYLEEAIDVAQIPVDDDYYMEVYKKWVIDMSREREVSFVQKSYIMPNEDMKEGPVVLKNDVLFKQVILGTIYVFLTFYLVFLVVNMVRDYEIGVKKKWYITSMSISSMVIGEYLSILIGSLPIVFAMTIVQYISEGQFLFFLIINMLIVVSYSGLFMLIGRLIRQVTVYVVLSTGITLIIGIISGSFFLIDTSHGFIGLIAFLTQTHYLLGEVMRGNILQAIIPSWSYISYMIAYGGILIGINYLFEKLLFKRFLRIEA